MFEKLFFCDGSLELRSIAVRLFLVELDRFAVMGLVPSLLGLRVVLILSFSIRSLERIKILRLWLHLVRSDHNPEVPSSFRALLKISWQLVRIPGLHIPIQVKQPYFLGVRN